MAPQPVSHAARTAAIYVRVSTERQEEEGTSLDSQEAACRAYCTEHGYTVSAEHIYRETYTGTELYARPKLNQMRDAVKAGALVAVVVYATDRLSRNPIHLGIIAEDCKRFDCSLEFVTEPLDDSPEGALLRYIKGYVGQKEHEKIRERTMRGKFTIVKAGKVFNFGAELYGFRRDKVARVRHVYESEAAIVRRIFRWVGEEHVPIRDVARRLNEEGVPSPAVGKIALSDGRQPRWGKTMVTRILTNPAYKGEPIAWYRQRVKGGKLIVRPEAERVKLAPGPAIVGADLYAAANARLHQGSADDTRNQKRPYLLRGCIYCAVCGKRLNSSPERTMRVYRCSSRDTAAGPCGGKRVPAEAVEAWAWEQVATILREPAIIAAEVERQREAGADSTLTRDMDTARQALAKLARQQERLVARLRDADDDVAALIGQELARLTQEKKAAHAAIDAMAAQLARQEADRQQLESLEAYCRAVAGRLSRFDLAEKRLAFEALAIRVYANGTDPATWGIRGAIPVGDVGAIDTTSEYCGRQLLRSPAPA